MYDNLQMQSMIPHTKKAIAEFIIATYLGGYCSEVVWVDEFETPKARHVCKGVAGVKLLDRQAVMVPTRAGNISVEVYYCPVCRKLLLGSHCL